MLEGGGLWELGELHPDWECDADVSGVTSWTGDQSPFRMLSHLRKAVKTGLGVGPGPKVRRMTYCRVHLSFQSAPPEGAGLALLGSGRHACTFVLC